MANNHIPDRSKTAFDLIANLNDEQLSNLEKALQEVSSKEHTQSVASLPAKQQLTPEEGLILLKAFNGPANEPLPRMLEAVANYKRIMSETL